MTSPWRASASTYSTTAASRPSPICPVLLILALAGGHPPERPAQKRYPLFQVHVWTTSRLMALLGTAATPRGMDRGSRDPRV